MRSTITPEELAIAKYSLSYALRSGADKCRVTLSKSVLDLFGIRDGTVEKVTHSLDRSLCLSLFVDGRFGTYSINRLEENAIGQFILSAIETTRMLEKDLARDLPAPERTARGAVDGLDLYDPSVESLTGEERLSMALRSSLHGSLSELESRSGCKIVSEEGEYSDSVSDTVILDSNGLECRSCETSFEIGYEVTVQDTSGARFSSFWWDASSRLKDLCLKDCSLKAFERAVAQIGPKSIGSLRTNVIVDSECASKLLNPILSALGGYSLQQNNSFLLDSLGKKIFSENVTVIDRPLDKGCTGARLFDSEGVATEESPIIEGGVVRKYFINTYIAGKTGFSPTVEDASRPVLLPCGGYSSLEDLLKAVGDGILLTGFNGGNSNSSTGDFSYGADGFVFKNGRITHPVREIVMTGNFITLWQNLIATADDSRACMARRIPSLAFANVDISA